MSFLDRVFGCSHKHRSFPITTRGKRRSGAAALTGTYVVCLDCGKEFSYDWETMRIVSAKEIEATPVSVTAVNSRVA